MNQDNNGLTKDIDQARVERTKIMMEYMKKHPNGPEQETPSVIPKLETSSKEEMELAELLEKMQKKSLAKNNGSKGTKKANAKKIATIIAASVATVTIIGTPVGVLVEKAVNASVIDKQLEAAVTYMDQTVLPEVLQRAGFIITGKDAKGNTTYDFDRYAYIRAQDILMSEYGFDRHSAELLLAETLNYDSRLYPTGDSNEYYEKLGYKREGPLFDSTDVFKNNNEVKVIYRVKDIKEEYEISQDSTPYVVDSSQVGGDEIGHARN
jgi:hypothetical protein